MAPAGALLALALAAAVLAPWAHGGAPAVDADVIVIGLGPVGNFLCHLLAGYRVQKVVAFEREAKEYQAPRAVGWDDYTLRAADAASEELSSYMRWHGAALWDVDRFEGCSGLRSGPADNRWNLACATGNSVRRKNVDEMLTSNGPVVAFHQPSWEREMRRRLSDLPGLTVAWDTDVVTTVIVDGVCEVTVEPVVRTAEAGGGGRRTYRARYCVAADGGASATRRQLGVSYEGTTFPDQPWIVVDTVINDVEYLRESWISREGLGFIVNHKCPFVFVPTPAFFDDWWATAQAEASSGKDKAERLRLRDEAMRRMVAPYGSNFSKGGLVYPPGTGFRFEVLLEPGVSEEEATSDAHVAELLRTCAEIDPTRVVVTRKVVYSFHSRRADTWRVGPVFLAGDAAHCMPPFQGQGLNAGIRDVANLAWKLSLVLRGVAHDSLLDSYQAERLSNLEQVSEGSLGLGKLVMVREPVVAWIRNAVMWTVHGLCSWFPRLGKAIDLFAGQPDIVSNRSVLHGFGVESVPGQLLPCPEVLVSGAQAPRFLDTLLATNGFTLVLCGGGAGGADALAAEQTVSPEALAFLQLLGAASVAVAPLAI